MLTDHPFMADKQPFAYGGSLSLSHWDLKSLLPRIRVKEINFSYHIEKIFNVDMQTLQHESDGLIYTCVGTPYMPGTDHTM